MVFNFTVSATVRAKSKEEVCNILKDKLGVDFFSKHISVNEEVPDKGQEVDVE